MSVKDNPNKEFEREYNGRQEQGTVLDSPDQVSQQAAKDASRTLPQGAPIVDYTVRSVYDSRPINGFDFNIVNTISVETGVLPDTFNLSIFTVPQNYVAIPRAWHHFIDPMPAGTTRRDFLFSLLLDDSDVQFNVDIPVGAESDELIRSFFVADEFQVIGVRFVTAVALPAGTDLVVHVYGNFLQKTGIPSQFQIANLAGKQKPIPLVASTIVPTTLPPEAAAPGTPTIQKPMPTAAQVRGKLLHASRGGGTAGKGGGVRTGLGRPKS